MSSTSIPLPALNIRPPQQSDPIEQYGRILQLRNMIQNAPLQQQALQQQVQQGQLGIQATQQDLAARQAINQAMASSVSKDENGKLTYDPDKLQNTLMTGPAAYKSPEILDNLNKFQQTKVALQNSMADLQNKQADLVGSAAAAVKASNYDPTMAHGILDNFFANNPNSPQAQQIRSVIDNPQALKQWVDTQIAQSPKQQQFANERTIAGIRANTPEMQGMNAWLQANPGKTAADYQQHKIDLQTQADIARETDPRVVAVKQQLAIREAAAKQALSQGDPNAAGQLLVNNDATLSELKARGATPEFIQQALLAARKLSNGTYNAPQAEAQFDVARSPANVAFFGSAKSLTDKGGTLDQLQNAAKDIPQNQIPALNSIDDWYKAATGSGPMAKYASIALGAADDYSKVMGGGAGSDTSRQKALDLFKANLSPAGRVGSIAGVRGAVGSQITSRIGNNPVLQRMYGAQGGPTGGTVTMKAPNGQTAQVPADQVEHYKSLGAVEVQ